MKIAAQLNRIEKDLGKVLKQITQDKGIETAVAFGVGSTAMAICENAACVAGLAREAMGKKDAKARLRRSVRKALGFYS
jgi:hypothetical protein